jgi:hypothetical protein
MNSLYRIEELGTDGWALVEDYKGLTKEVAKEKLDLLIADGYNPNRLRAIVDGNPS